MLRESLLKISDPVFKKKIMCVYKNIHILPSLFISVFYKIKETKKKKDVRNWNLTAILHKTSVKHSTGRIHT